VPLETAEEQAWLRRLVRRMAPLFDGGQLPASARGARPRGPGGLEMMIADGGYEHYTGWIGASHSQRPRSSLGCSRSSGALTAAVRLR
jgi:hypothetical protein